MVTATASDALWIDMENEKELDIDEIFGIGNIKAIKYQSGKFYILANKYQKKLGVFLLEIDTRNF